MNKILKKKWKLSKDLRVVSKQKSSGKSIMGSEKSQCKGPEVKSHTVGMEAKEVNEAWEEWVRDQVLKKDTEVNRGNTM